MGVGPSFGKHSQVVGMVRAEASQADIGKQNMQNMRHARLIFYRGLNIATFDPALETVPCVFWGAPRVRWMLRSKISNCASNCGGDSG